MVSEKEIISQLPKIFFWEFTISIYIKLLEGSYLEIVSNILTY